MEKPRKCIFCLQDAEPNSQWEIAWSIQCADSMQKLLDLEPFTSSFFEAAEYCPSCKGLMRDVDFMSRSVYALEKRLGKARRRIAKMLLENFGEWASSTHEVECQDPDSDTIPLTCNESGMDSNVGYPPTMLTFLKISTEDLLYSSPNYEEGDMKLEPEDPQEPQTTHEDETCRGQPSISDCSTSEPELPAETRASVDTENGEVTLTQVNVDTSNSEMTQVNVDTANSEMTQVNVDTANSEVAQVNIYTKNFESATRRSTRLSSRPQKRRYPSEDEESDESVYKVDAEDNEEDSDFLISSDIDEDKNGEELDVAIGNKPELIHVKTYGRKVEVKRKVEKKQPRAPEGKAVIEPINTPSLIKNSDVTKQDEKRRRYAAEAWKFKSWGCLGLPGCSLPEETYEDTFLFLYKLNQEDSERDLPHGCPVPGCQRRFQSTSALERHDQEMHGIITLVDSFQCFMCPQRTRSALRLDTHISKFHLGLTHPFNCPVPLCTSRYKYNFNLANHMTNQHPGIEYKENGEQRVDMHPDRRQGYANNTNAEELRPEAGSESLSETEFRCDVPGCNKRFKTIPFLHRHLDCHQPPLSERDPRLCKYSAASSSSIAFTRKPHQLRYTRRPRRNKSIPEETTNVDVTPRKEPETPNCNAIACPEPPPTATQANKSEEEERSFLGGKSFRLPSKPHKEVTLEDDADRDEVTEESDFRISTYKSKDREKGGDAQEDDGCDVVLVSVSDATRNEEQGGIAPLLNGNQSNLSFTELFTEGTRRLDRLTKRLSALCMCKYSDVAKELGHCSISAGEFPPWESIIATVSSPHLPEETLEATFVFLFNLTQEENRAQDIHGKILDSFQCFMCYQRTSSEIRMDEHISKFHGRETLPFPCPVSFCFSQYQFKPELTRHMATQHPRVENDWGLKELATHELRTEKTNGMKDSIIERLIPRCMSKYSDVVKQVGKCATNAGEFPSWKSIIGPTLLNPQVPEETFEATFVYLFKLTQEENEKGLSCGCPLPGCHRRFKHAKNWEVHAREIHGHIPESFQCFICDGRTTSALRLDTHISKSHGGETHPFQCPVPLCSSQYKCKYELANHMATQHPGVEYKEENGGRVFRNRGRQGATSKFCEEDGCSYRTMNPKCLRAHLIKVHCQEQDSGNLYECDTCGAGFEKFNRYSHHRSYAHKDNDKKPICEFCGKMFGGRGKLTGHIRWTHFEVATKFNCNVCARPYFSPEDCADHEELHTKVPPFSCVLGCGSKMGQYGSSEELVKHVQGFHDEVNKVVCHVCGYSATGLGANARLKTHMNVHTKEKTFKCKYCDKTFRHLSEQRTHQEVHHPDQLKKEYKCGECGEVFKVYIYYYRHRRYKHGEPVKRKKVTDVA